MVSKARGQPYREEQLTLTDSIVVVILRRPGKNDPRNDPFWEFGSFGLTGCHKDNLLHPKNARELDGVRLAFAQGGKDGFKLVFLTSPISTRHHTHRCEARWEPALMPFKYESAPVLVANSGQMIGGMKEALSGVRRTTNEAKFSSRFRSRKRPLNEEFRQLAEHIISEFDSLYATAREKGTLAKTYDQVLPWPIDCPDRQREDTYGKLLDEAGGLLVYRECRSLHFQKARACAKRGK